MADRTSKGSFAKLQSDLIYKQAAIDGAVVERNPVLVLEIHFTRKVGIAGDESTGHAFAVVGDKLADPVVKLLELFDIARYLLNCLME